MNYLKLKYWFTLQPEPLLPLFFKIFVILTAIFIALAIITKLAENKKTVYKNIINSLHQFFTTQSLIALILLFFNYEHARFFSARFWLLFWAIFMLIWLVVIIKKVKKIPEQRQKLEAEKEYKKYLP